MRQKMGIAIAYAKKAKVYLLDEPASGLDPVASNELSTLLKKLADEGAAILMASHNIFRVLGKPATGLAFSNTEYWSKKCKLRK